MSLTMNQCGVIDNYHQQVHKYKRAWSMHGPAAQVCRRTTGRNS